MMELVELIAKIQTFISYFGLTFFTGGLIFCFIATTFRYGVFCTLCGNVMFGLAIVFPKDVALFIEKYNFSPLFTNIDDDTLRVKAIITGLIFMVIIWTLRWFKHVVTEGFLAFIFPSYFQLKVKGK